MLNKAFRYISGDIYVARAWLKYGEKVGSSNIRSSDFRNLHDFLFIDDDYNSRPLCSKQWTNCNRDNRRRFVRYNDVYGLYWHRVCSNAHVHNINTLPDNIHCLPVLGRERVERQKEAVKQLHYTRSTNLTVFCPRYLFKIEPLRSLQLTNYRVCKNEII